MIRNKKGLSAVVTTLIIILLVLVAVGVLYTVFMKFIKTGTETMDLNTKCLAVNIEAIAVKNESPMTNPKVNYSIRLTRTAGGDEIAGIKIVLLNDTASSSVIDVPGNIEPLATVTKNIENVEVQDASKIEVTVYFKDESGNEQLCSQKSIKEF